MAFLVMNNAVEYDADLAGLHIATTLGVRAIRVQALDKFVAWEVTQIGRSDNMEVGHWHG